MDRSRGFYGNRTWREEPGPEGSSEAEGSDMLPSLLLNTRAGCAWYLG